MKIEDKIAITLLVIVIITLIAIGTYSETRKHYEDKLCQSKGGIYKLEVCFNKSVVVE